MYTNRDLSISRKYKEFFPVVIKAKVLASNSEVSRFSIFFYDSKMNRRKLILNNTSEITQFMFDDEFCIYWTIANISGKKTFIYWSWPEDVGCSD